VKKLSFVGAVLLLALAYLFNLGSAYAPTNGDEMVYLHIARLTAESGAWLPLQSELPNMRNTKPPFLFWQAMFAGQFSWDLHTLRLPYVLETLLTAGMVGWLAGYLIKVRPQLNLLAAALYLGFFATYRYGRPVLSSSIESLFLFGVCALVIAQQSAWKAHPIRLAAVAGLLMIPALLSKSFVLAAPVGLWLFLSLWLIKPFGLSLSKAILPAAIAVAIGLAGFAFWFAVDPNPAAVWREFVIGENFSTKFSDARSDSILLFWLSPFINAGLLFPLVFGLCVAALQGLFHAASQPSSSEKMLWLWVLCWMLVFTLPSQRSSRYVIPMMPAIAVLLAMYADRIHRIWWMLTLALTAFAAVALSWIAWCLDAAFVQGLGYSWLYFAAMAVAVLACVIGIFIARYRIVLTAACAVVWLTLLGAFAVPFDAPSNQYSEAVKAQFAGQKILAPQNFNAQFERFVFVLPASKPMPYESSQGLPASFNQGDTIASRLVLRSRHASGEVTLEKLMTRAGVQALLVEREVLIGTKR
jgi:hypothetical protein